jgi:tetratricopeptide (TPR) repeat protein
MRSSERTDLNPSSNPRASADRSIEANRPEQATAACREEVAINPDNVTARSRLAQLLIREEQWHKALTACREAVELLPDAAEFHDLLGQCQVQTGDYSGAVASFRKAVEIDPTRPRLYDRLGEVLFQENRVDEALSAYRKGLKRRPKAHGLHAMIGLCEARKGNNSKAAAHFRKAVALAPKRAWLHEQLGAALRAQEKWKEAAAAYRNAIKLKPKAPELHNWLGLCLAKSGDLQNAAANYWKEFEINPIQQADLHIKFGQDLIQKGHPDDALNLYQTMIEAHPALPLRFYLAFADAVQQVGPLNQAIAAYRKAARSNAANDKGYLIVGGLCAAADQPDQAIDAFKKAFAINPDQPWPVRHMLGNALKRCAQYEEAEAYLKEGATVPADQASQYSTLWEAVSRNDWQAIDSKPPFHSAQPAPDSAEQHFIQTAEYQVLDLDSLTQENQSVLERQGLSVEFLDAYRNDPVGRQPSLHRQYHASTRTISDSSPAGEGAATETPAELYSSLIETGCLYAWCPISGEIVRSNHSLGADETLARGFFRFQGERPFYLITDDRWTTIAALYLPDDEIIILLSENAQAAELTDLINRFKATSVIHWQSIRKYLDDHGPKKILCPLNVPPRSGHDLWACLSGLQRLSLDGRLDQIDRFLVAPDSIHEQLPELFPSISSDKMIRAADGTQPNVLETVLDDGLLAVRCVDPVITEALTEKVPAVAREHCPASTFALIEKAKQRTPLIWVTLDAGPRQWRSQEAGIENIINYLADRFPMLGVVFSGTGARTESDPPGSEKIRRLQEKTIAEEIGHFLAPDVPRYHLFDKTIAEHIAWATAVDLYIAPQKPGTTCLPWIVNKPGVVYGAHDTAAPRTDPVYHSLREGVISPTFIAADSDNETEQKAERQTAVEHQSRPLADYACDWSEIHKALTTTIDALGLQEPTPQKKRGLFRSLITMFTGKNH